MRVSNLLALIMAAIVWLAFPTAQAHEGHDHDAPKAPVSATIAPRTEVVSDAFELVAIARGGELVIHLDGFETNAPISGAEIEVDTPAGLTRAVAKGDGVYQIPAPFLAKPGRYDLAFTVSAGATVDVLAATITIPEATATAAPPGSWVATPAIAQGLRQSVGATGIPVWLALLIGFAGGVGTMALWRGRAGRASAVALVAAGALAVSSAPTEAAAEVAAASRDQAQRFPDGALFVPKTTQHILALRTIRTAERVHQRTIELPGRIVPNPNASGLVQASVGGRLSPPPGGFKALGTPVKAGDVLAFVMPPLPLADATTQQQQARELDQQIAIVGNRLQRYRSLIATNAVARSQLEDAELELKGLQARRANLDRVQREPEALVSPVNGIIAASNAVAGQMAEPNAVIFQIVDSASLWVEALSYEAQSTSQKARGSLANGRTIDLDYVGTGFTDRNQAVPVQFAITSDTKGLRAGQFITVLATTLDAQTGIAVPRQAVLRGSNGQSLVYEHTDAERFVEREVRIAPLDGASVLIVAGIEAGRRIVTQGAELLNQIR